MSIRRLARAELIGRHGNFLASPGRAASDPFKNLKGQTPYVRLMQLTDMPNIGPKVAAKLRRLGIESMEDLRGNDGEALFERLCAMDGRRHDPCLLDTFVAAVDFADGGPARPWWEYSRERLARTV